MFGGAWRLPASGRHYHLARGRQNAGRTPPGVFLVLGLDEGLHLRAGQGLGQLLHAGVVLVVRACDQEVHVRRVLALDRQCILGRVEARIQCVVGVDQGQVDLVQHARQHRRVQLAELQVLRVCSDVTLGRQRVGRILQLDHTGLVQQDQCTAVVARVVRDHHVGTFAQLGQRLDLARVRTERLDVHADHLHQIGLAIAVVGIQIRLGLEVVGVHLLLHQLVVGLHVVVEHAHVQVHAFLLEDRLDHFKDLGMRHGRGGHHQLLRGLAGLAAGGQGQRSGEQGQQQGLLHGRKGSRGECQELS